MTATLAALDRRITRLQQATTLQPHQDTALALSPLQIARLAGIEPDPWQCDFLTAQDQFILCNCSRQAGKSLCSAVVAVHTALYQDDATILLLAPSLRQASELFRVCMQIYNRLGRPVKPIAESTLRLELANGSRIISLPGSEQTVRGISRVDLLVLDEASRIPDELFTAVSPMRAVSNGRLMLLSTPFGARGRFYQSYQQRAEGWRYFEINAEMCPRISPEFLESERKNLGEWHFLQEYFCQFMSTQAASFRVVDIEAIMKVGTETWTF